MGPGDNAHWGAGVDSAAAARQRGALSVAAGRQLSWQTRADHGADADAWTTGVARVALCAPGYEGRVHVLGRRVQRANRGARVASMYAGDRRSRRRPGQ